MKTPAQVTIGDQEYRVTVTALMKEEYAGECHQDTKIIIISADQGEEEAWVTFFHEWLHGVEEEFKVKLGHGKIKKLEHALAQLFPQLCKKRR
jgi:hypothetical protein